MIQVYHMTLSRTGPDCVIFLYHPLKAHSRSTVHCACHLMACKNSSSQAAEYLRGWLLSNCLFCWIQWQDVTVDSFIW